MPDGSVSTKTTRSLIYRDETGRTRRDWLAEPSSPNEVESTAVKRSVINDPSTGFTYALDHRANVAQRKGFVGIRPLTAPARQNPTTQRSLKDQILPMASSSGTDNSLRSGQGSASASQTPQSLGGREIEGVLAEDTRFTFTLPAKADNEKPMEIVTERWYAPSIQAVVLVKRTDPRAGESVYRLTNIKRGVPSAALFTLPQNYRLIDEAGREVSSTRSTPTNDDAKENQMHHPSRSNLPLGRSLSVFLSLMILLNTASFANHRFFSLHSFASNPRTESVASEPTTSNNEKPSATSEVESRKPAIQTYRNLPRCGKHGLR